jgi:hypothetical protein
MGYIIAFIAGAIFFGRSSNTYVIEKKEQPKPRPLTKAERKEQARLAKIPLTYSNPKHTTHY